MSFETESKAIETWLNDPARSWPEALNVQRTYALFWHSDRKTITAPKTLQTNVMPLSVQIVPGTREQPNFHRRSLHSVNTPRRHFPTVELYLPGRYSPLLDPPDFAHCYSTVARPRVLRRLMDGLQRLRWRTPPRSGGGRPGCGFAWRLPLASSVFVCK